LILDLLANARRRMDEQRWDDATARLYRAIEATAQLRLAERGIPDTGSVPLEQIPEPLRSELASQARSGQVKLGLQEAWHVLKRLDEPAAAPFFDASLADPEKSPLAARNQSILAHGFAPASEENTRRLLDAALATLGAAEAELPASPLAGLETPAATPLGNR
jgi:CRISPR-associated protein (TIGR02710 family)